MTGTPACDRCKRRKVRCDGADPCSNCSRSRTACERRTLPQRPGPRVAKRPADAESPEQEQHEIESPKHRVARNDSLRCVASWDHGLQEQIDMHRFPGAGMSTPSSSIYSFTRSPDSVEVTFPTLAWGDLVNVRSRLIAKLDSSPARSGSVEDVAHRCVDLFMQYLFPNTPIAHEPTLRTSIPLLSGDTYPDSASAENLLPNVPPQITFARRFTLIAALCAHIISVVPESLSQIPQSLSNVFFEASRSMLRIYEAYDLEHPDSTSLTIRMWHSSAAQNTTGKLGASSHYHTEACCLAQRLRLFDESSISRPSLLESELLRINFWHLYLAEKTQIALQTRPPVIDEKICTGGITLLEKGDASVAFLDPSREVNQLGLESRIFIGFHLRRRIAATAARLIEDIPEFPRRTKVNIPPIEKLNWEGDGMNNLIERYLKFEALLNEVPPWMRHPDREAGGPKIDDVHVRMYQATCFWAQKCNIMAYFHCMRVLILQACIDNNLPAIVGLSDSPLAWASRKLEIMRACLDELQETPFACIESQGETMVDKIRRVGVILLELVHNSTNATVKTQAEVLFKGFLDIISALNSKASDDL